MNTLTYPMEYIRDGSGFYENGLAGETLGARSLVYRDGNGAWQLADQSNLDNMPTLGITIGAISSGRYGRILTQGYIGDESWSWTAGDALYVSTTPGVMTQTAPTTGYRQIVAYANTGDMIFMLPWESLSASGLQIEDVDYYVSTSGLDTNDGEDVSCR
ncbi:unnamed protein product [marine sediment metagenome]|uniref:Uncharacterized protein n=1 Tax=marine sediment metagenome TaxID=412755 RepID=X1B1L2_9ZZZZ